MALSDAVLLQHERTLRGLSSLIADQCALLRAQLPTIWGMEQLRAKWPGLSDEHIKALLAQHGGYQPARGVKPAVHLDVVLKIDAILAGRTEAAHGEQRMARRSA